MIRGTGTCWGLTELAAWKAALLRKTWDSCWIVTLPWASSSTFVAKKANRILSYMRKSIVRRSR